MERIKYIANILVVALLFLTVAVRRDGRIVGIDAEDIFKHTKQTDSVNAITVLPDGTRVINTTSITSDVIGFGGRTPIALHVKDGKISKLEILPNDETPSFIKLLKRRGIESKWDGLTIEEAATKSMVDGMTGATYSATAIEQNVQRAAQFASNIESVSSDKMFSKLGLKEFAALGVILLGVFVTFTKIKDKKVILLQQILNVAVLGFWTGSFLSLSQVVTWASNGLNMTVITVPLVLLCVVLILPLFGKKGSYCHIHCPMGAAQELMGALPIKKLRLSPAINKFLNALRYYILIALLFTMWLGVGFDIVNYEVFSAFIFDSASIVVLVMAGVFLLLSVVIPRPYCRFICPTGALITMSQKSR